MEVEIQDEKHTGRVAAVYGDEVSANAAKQKLIDNGISRSVISIVKPEDKSISRKIEPESQNIYKTIIKSHGWLGLIGAIIGIVIATGLVTAGPEMTQSQPHLYLFCVYLLWGGIWHDDRGSDLDSSGS